MAPPSPTCSARWCRSCSRPSRGRRTRAPGAHRARARACRRDLARVRASASASRCSTATARPRRISSSAHRPRPAARRDGPGRRWLRGARGRRRRTMSCRDGEAGELVLRADEPFAFATRLFRHAGEDGRGVAQSLVPHRRSRGARRRRLFPLHRPAEGRDPPARREHLVLSRSSRCC